MLAQYLNPGSQLGPAVALVVARAAMEKTAASLTMTTVRLKADEQVQQAEYIGGVDSRAVK